MPHDRLTRRELTMDDYRACTDCGKGYLVLPDVEDNLCPNCAYNKEAWQVSEQEYQDYKSDLEFDKKVSGKV